MKEGKTKGFGIYYEINDFSNLRGKLNMMQPERKLLI